MFRRGWWVPLCVFSVFPGCSFGNGERAPLTLREVRTAILAGGVVRLPAGTLHLDAPLEIPPTSQGVEIRGHPSGTILQMTPAFNGKAVIVARDPIGLTLRGFTIRGNRGKPERGDKHLPPSNVTFADFYDGNGVVVTGGQDVHISRLVIRGIAGFAVIVSAVNGARVEELMVSDSGSLNSLGRNNTSGGILLEEGTTNFTVRGCTVERVAGNGIWTHSNYESPRNADGLITENVVSEVARDAIQVGHATRVQVTRNRGSRIGFPLEQIDLEGQANPAAVDSAGDVDLSVYSDNHFRDVNGHCIDLDGFHHGTATRNSCVNIEPHSAFPYSTYGALFNNTNIDMTSEEVEFRENLFLGFAYGGAYVIGSRHRVLGNYFLDVNRAKCTGDVSRPGCQYAPNEPEALRSGVFLTKAGARPAVTEENEIRGNVIIGFGMDRWCIGKGLGVDLSKNSIGRNVCQSLP